MYCQLCVANRGIVRSGLRRIPAGTRIRSLSTVYTTRKDERNWTVLDTSKHITSNPGPPIRFVQSSKPVSTNHLLSSLDSWSEKAGRISARLEERPPGHSRRERAVRGSRVLRVLPDIDAEGELCLIKESTDWRVFRRLPGTNHRLKRPTLNSLEDGGLHPIKETKDEKRFIPLPSKSAADAIREVRQRAAKQNYGPSEWRPLVGWDDRSSSGVISSRAFSTYRSLQATPESLNSVGIESLLRTITPQPDIGSKTQREPANLQERLRAWDVANPRVKRQTFEDRNISAQTRIESSLMGILEDYEQKATDEGGGRSPTDVEDILFDKDEILDFGDYRSFLARGDMVELKYGRGSELAIFVRNRGDLYDFYTLSGRWLQWAEAHSYFCVPQFIEPAKLQPLVDFMSLANEPMVAVPGHIGAPLIAKMRIFSEEANQIYRNHAKAFSRAHLICAHKSTVKNFTLPEIADKIVSDKLKQNGKYSAQLLYALYLSIDVDSTGFQPALTNRRGETQVQFSLTPKDEMRILRYVRSEVRKYLDAKTKENAEKSSFMGFVRRAQILIDQSRKCRDVTSHGTLGPLKLGYQAHETPLVAENYFTEVDLPFIRFLESWACRRTFPSESPYSAIGSIILRTIDRYSEMDLNQSTGWVLLQELGVLSPAANPAAYMLNVPLSGGLFPENPEAKEPYDIVPDVLSGLRRDWGDLPIYCIDEAGAHEIDDGISIENAEQPGEYWVHIHTANPGSQINPKSQLGRESEAKAGTLYVPEKVVGMLPGKLVQEKFSLAPGRPSITYSARLNLDGVILEQLATPGTLRNIIYLTPETTEEAIQGYPTVLPERMTMVVGGQSCDSHMPVTRPLVPIGQLLSYDRENLKLLYTLSLARVKHAAERGGITDDMREKMFGNAANKSPVHISTSFISGRPSSSASGFRSEPDPRIEMRTLPAKSLHLPGCSTGWEKAERLVKSLMLMGGEIAGRWCHERGIPVIYRVSQRNDSLMAPADYYRQQIQPRLLAAEEIPAEVLTGYLAMVGIIQPSSTPGPHLTLGMEMFAKSTSPLRRFGDLLLQWQVQAGILEEAKLGTSLIGSKRDDYLPFTKSRVDQIIPTLKTKELEMRLSQGMAEMYWCFQLLIRAWKFNQAKLPKTFEFVIREFRHDYILGYLRDFGGLVVRLKYPEWLRPEDVKLSGAFEVKIVDINAYDRKIYADALRYIRGPTILEL